MASHGKKALSHKPDGVHDVVASLTFKDCGAAIEFYKEAFGADELTRMPSPDGKKIWHAQLRIGDTVLFLNDEGPGGAVVAPSAEHKPTGSLQLYVADCDATFNRAVSVGGKPLMAMSDMFWGDRMGMLQDPSGHVWAVSTRKQELTDAELRLAGEEFVAKMKGQGQG